MKIKFNNVSLSGGTIRTDREKNLMIKGLRV